MRQRFAWMGALVVVAGLLSVRQTQAVITVLIPLQKVLAENQLIFTIKVDSLDPSKPAAVFTLDENFKGKAPFQRLAVNLKGDSEAEKEKHTPQLLRRLAPGLPVVLFVNERGSRYTAFAYTNGTWFQMAGRKDDDGTVRWTFSHCEPYLRRTFKGTTAELRQIVIDGLAGTRKPPAPNPDEKPGFGPEVEKKEEKTGSRANPPSVHGGPPLAVIPTVLVGGPLAILALLFPAVFGGVLLLFHRWLAFFTVVTFTSTFYLVHQWFAGQLVGSWWGTQTALWCGMTLATLAGTFWASRRSAPDAAPRTELVVLWVLSLACLAGVAWCLLFQPPARFDTAWNLLLTLSLGIWTATLYRAIRPLLARGGSAMATEGVILWTALFAFTAFAAARPGGQSVVSHSGAAGEGRPTAQFQEEAYWIQTFTGNGGGMVVSSPLVAGDRIYVAAVHLKGFQQFGVLYCVDRNTRDVLWTFDNDGDMKPVYSSPRIADGWLYIGEGLHDSADCRFYCLDAQTGKPRWPAFQTSSQTESSACIHDGRLFFGAGNDGVYSLDARTGKKLWQFPENPGQSPLLRICGTPAAEGNRLFAGSGVDRNRPDDPGETAVFCLDPATGRQIWKVATNLPCWAAPVPLGEHVLFALGSGDLFTDAPKPAGAVLCLEAATGREVWRVEVPNGVLERPAHDAHRVYFGSRDGHCYCVSRSDGKELWKHDLGSPVVAAVALDGCRDCARTTSVYAVSANGRVSCLDPYTGKAHWTYSGLEQNSASVCSAITVSVRHEKEGDRRRLYFGASLNDKTVPALVCLEDLLPER